MLGCPRCAIRARIVIKLKKKRSAIRHDMAFTGMRRIADALRAQIEEPYCKPLTAMLRDVWDDGHWVICLSDNMTTVHISPFDVDAVVDAINATVALPITALTPRERIYEEYGREALRCIMLEVSRVSYNNQNRRAREDEDRRYPRAPEADI
jgi:hypothetical protein